MVIRKKNNIFFMKTKICVKCNKELPANLDYFYYERSKKDKLKSWCKKCQSEYNKQYREKYKEEWKEYRKKWREINKERIKEYRESHNKSNKKWKRKNWEEYMNKHLLHKRIRKKKRIQEYCSICNEKKKQLDLANISGSYKEDINDYIWLCRECHSLFDKINQTHIKIKIRG